MRTIIWYEAVQVVSRHPDGAIAEWYSDNERREHRLDAIEDRNVLTEAYPTTEYTIIEIRVAECGQPRIGKVKVVRSV